MPWLVLDTLGVDSAAFIGGLFLIFVAPSIIGALSGTWILWAKERSLFLGLLLGFAIGAGGTALGWGLVVLSDRWELHFVGLTLAVVALFAVAKYLPER